MKENEEYYQLRPYVRCQTASGEFDVSIHNGGPLDIYYDEKLDEEAANDLAFYLEKKLPYITGVQALQITIYRFTGAGDLLEWKFQESSSGRSGL